MQKVSKKLNELLNGRKNRSETLDMHFAFITYVTNQEGWTRSKAVNAIRTSFSGNHDPSLLAFAKGWVSVRK